MYTALSLPSSPHSYSCWEHRPRSHPYPSAQYHGEPHLPVPISCPLFPLSGTTPLFTAALGSQFTLAPRIRIPVVSCILHPQFLLLFFSPIFPSPSAFLPICLLARHPENPACLSYWKTAFGSGPYSVVRCYYCWVKRCPLPHSLIHLLFSLRLLPLRP